jgi:type IV secretory pathway VirD2 relaxase
MEKSPVEVPILRPRIGGRGGEVAFQRAPLFCRSVLARVQLRFGRAAGLGRPRPARKNGTRAVADVLRPTAKSRRCVVKARVVRMNEHGMKAARLHLAYIERDGVERDGSEGRLYGSSDAIDRGSLSETIPGEHHQFRFIVSPEDDIDLTTFTRDLMGRVERDLGVRLRWGAVNHYNTDNPHAHVIVRGVDDSGRQVRIDRSYISEGMRWQAQHLLTAELGPRLDHEIERQLEREVGQERLTTIDRRLADILGPDQTTDVARLALTTDSRNRRRIIGRLKVLETLHLAARTSPRSWRLAANWQTALRDLGERGDIIKRIHRALGAAGDPSRYEVIDDRADHPTMEGVLRRKGLHDELRGDVYAVVETMRGEAAYVRLDPVASEAVTEGVVVRVAVEKQAWAKPMDRVLEQVARENGGVYDPAAHLRALRQQPIAIGGRGVPAEAVIEANVRRLSRLERYRLVTRLEGGRWRVPPDLVSTLKTREVTHPRRFLRVQTIAPPIDRQISARAPSWLDLQDTGAPRAPYGLGAELGAAIEARAAFLARIEIPREPREQRIRALERLEQVELGRKLAAELGVTALATAPANLRGRLVACGHGGAGTPMAYVIDEATRRLVVVSLPPEAGAWSGRTVTLSRDAKGELLIRPDGLTRGA